MSSEIVNKTSMKILIVDDNKDNVELVCQVLEDEYTLITAYSGEECIEKALVEQPNLILLDVNMPQMDGYETMQKLQRYESTTAIPVIFASAYYKESSMIVKGLEQGAFDFLTKPIDEDILLAKVRVVRRMMQAESEIRRQKNELQIINNKLESADKLKSIFLASMSHELRTPLNSIIGFTGLMLMQISGEINDAQREQLERVKRNANHLLELINDVLDISKIEAGKMEPVITEFDIVELLRDLSQSIAPEINNKGLKFEVSLPDYTVMIRNDSRRIRQIVMNLLSNALKFTTDGEIMTTLVVEDTQNICISIKDTGVGVKHDDLDKLFEPFQQINADFTKSYKGTGLGLYICKKLSHIIGGELKVKSLFGEGSQFSLLIPVSINTPKFIEKKDHLQDVSIV